MKTKSILLLIALFFNIPLVRGQGTAFTYQGLFLENGTNASGTYDLRFTIYDTGGNSGGNVIAGPLLRPAVSVTNGLFTTTLDFGTGVFTGNSRWLDIGVRTNGSAAVHQLLLPRQAITATPYAIQAAGISGTLPDSQLSANVPRLNASNAFTGPVTFTPASGSPFAIAGSSSNKVIRGLNADQLDGLDSTALWKTTGNMGTAGGVNFLGTTDNTPLEFRVNNQRVLRFQYGSFPNYVNVIGGNSNNFVSPVAQGTTISGGTANTNNALLSFIGGGGNNTILGSSSYSVIVGGDANTVGPNTLRGVIGGGEHNAIRSNAFFATIAGGNRNTIGDTATRATISGGEDNVVGTLAEYATIPGGFGNSAAGPFSFAAGYRAKANHDGSFVWSDTSTAQDFASTGPQQFIIRAIGGVGIGTTTPRARLDVNNDSFDVKILNVGYGAADDFGDIFEVWRLAGGNGETFIRGRNRIHLASNLNTPIPTLAGATLTIDGGKVGIGTTTPQFPLDVQNPALLVASLSSSWDDEVIAFNATDTRISGIEVHNSSLTKFQNPEKNVGIVFAVGSQEHNALGFLGFATGSRRFFVAPGDDNGRFPPTFVVEGNGNVGIGTATSGERLRIIGPGPSATLMSLRALDDSARLRMDYNGSVTAVGTDGNTRLDLGAAAFSANSSIPNALTLLPNGNVGVGTPSPNERLHVIGNLRVTGTIIPPSDRNVKSRFAAVNSRDVLERVTSMPIQTWTYTNDASGTRHIGPVAQDFHAAFGVGADDKHIATVDADGVALAAIQGLNEVVKEKDAKIDSLERRLAALERLVTSLTEKLPLH